MCTVSYLPHSRSKLTLTSSRDESRLRKTNPPIKQMVAGNAIYFPQDEIAGGTWIAASSNKRISCLLNGAFQNHIRKDEYGKSRGKILLESFEFSDVDEFVNLADFENVEPFTLIFIQLNKSLKLTELRWDGFHKYYKTLDSKKPQIWSSATLYNENARKIRNQWFNDWLNNSTQLNEQNIWKFHSSSHGNDPSMDILMKRNEILQTVSITQITMNNQLLKMRYQDLIHSKYGVIHDYFQKDNSALIK